MNPKIQEILASINALSEAEQAFILECLLKDAVTAHSARLTQKPMQQLDALAQRQRGRQAKLPLATPSETTQTAKPAEKQTPIISDIRQLAMSDWPDDMTTEEVDAFIQKLRSSDKRK